MIQYCILIHCRSPCPHGEMVCCLTFLTKVFLFVSSSMCWSRVWTTVYGSVCTSIYVNMRILVYICGVSHMGILLCIPSPYVLSWGHVSVFESVCELCLGMGLCIQCVFAMCSCDLYNVSMCMSMGVACAIVCCL